MSFAEDLHGFLCRLSDAEGLGQSLDAEARQKAAALARRAGAPRGRLAPSLLTYTGVEFAPFEPRISAVRIMDIAHALSCICRFGGQAGTFYSVAQHSVLVSRLCEPQDALYGLLHDASEAYLGDIPSPIKPLFPGYAEAEERLRSVIHGAFGLAPAKRPESVHIADAVALRCEQRALMLDVPFWPHQRWALGDAEVRPLLPKQAEALFMQRFDELSRSMPKLWGAA